MAAEATSKHRAQVKWDAVRDDLRAHTIELAGQRLAASATAALRDPAINRFAVLSSATSDLDETAVGA